MKWDSSSLIAEHPYSFRFEATKPKEHCLKESGIKFADHRAFLQLDLNFETGITPVAMTSLLGQKPTGPKEKRS